VVILLYLESLPQSARNWTLRLSTSDHQFSTCKESVQALPLEIITQQVMIRLKECPWEVRDQVLKASKLKTQFSETCWFAYSAKSRCWQLRQITSLSKDMNFSLRCSGTINHAMRRCSVLLESITSNKGMKSLNVFWWKPTRSKETLLTAFGSVIHRCSFSISAQKKTPRRLNMDKALFSI